MFVLKRDVKLQLTQLTHIILGSVVWDILLVGRFELSTPSLKALLISVTTFEYFTTFASEPSFGKAYRF